MLPRVVEAERVPGAVAGPGVRGAQLPAPRTPIRVRLGTLADVPFMDGLQKLHTKQVGWMPTKQFEGKVKLGHVLIAEDDAARPVGYCIGNDQYFKRDDVGIIYQMNVAPGSQRGFVGATLLKSMFDRAAWGCKLFCCWCAQDIGANRFWEAMGFVPLAFRAGSRKRDRIHIFWQKRIRQGDVSTPWWFPAQTGGGSIREDRLVLPIPPGTHWSDAKPLVLPEEARAEEEAEVRAKGAKVAKTERKKAAVGEKQPTMATVGVRFGPPPASPGVSPPAAQAQSDSMAKAKREKKPKPVKKNDPKLVAAARELRDRYLEEVNSGRALLEAQVGKYDVTRALEGHGSQAGPEALQIAA